MLGERPYRDVTWRQLGGWLIDIVTITPEVPHVSGYDYAARE
jgi:hypothetical protein